MAADCGAEQARRALACQGYELSGERAAEVAEAAALMARAARRLAADTPFEADIYGFATFLAEARR